MEYKIISIYTTSEGVEPVCCSLYEVGVTGVEVCDKADFDNFVENNKQYWDYIDDDLLNEKDVPTQVKVYVLDDENAVKTVDDIKNALENLKNFDKSQIYGTLDISFQSIKEEDWANNWKKYYFPFEVGKKILIKPKWQTLDKPTNRVVFENNPGASFGTGMHDSTKLCMEAIEQYLSVGDSVLDLGCGSGILSIISILLGAKSAFGIDIDPNSVEVSLSNARDNGVNNEQYKVITGNILEDENLVSEMENIKFDMVIANIVADVIIPLSSVVPRFMKDDGVFITSGIIDHRIDDVKDELHKHFKIVEIKRKGDWAEMTCKL